MLETLKKIDKKFLIILGCMILLPIILIIILVLVQSCSNKKTTYTKYEEKMISAAERYFGKKDNFPTEESDFIKVELSKLVEEGYIKNTKTMLGDESCSGSVTVRRNGSSKELEEEGFLNYTVNLTCDKYSTNSLKNNIMKSLVTDGSGLYLVGDEYIFKGDSPRNYITFYDASYRIMGIDKNGIIKMIKSEPEMGSDVWDNKYNTDAKRYSGINKYSDSFLLKRITNLYNNNKELKNAKAKIVANDICIGSRDNNNLSLNRDCSTVLEKQPISLINITDYAFASLDKECNSIKNRACGNYNYLSGLSLSTWTLNAVSNDSYNVYYLDSGVIEYKESSSTNRYNIVIYIDGDEIIDSGMGTQTDPYVIN